MRTTILLLCLMALLNLSSFAQSITVTSPNGGETWAGCTTHNITWTATGTSNYYTINYSTDGGTSWAIIANNYNTTSGTFSWTVPNTPSTNCLIKIFDSQNSSTVDQSNLAFIITSPLQITSPNGGETWQGLTVQNITWTATGTSNYYTIEYSTNSGSTWSTIVNNYYTTGTSYSWTVPNNPSANCLIRVTDYNSACKTDISNSFFTITPATQTITVTSPNGGESWIGCTVHNITWNAVATSNYYSIYYSTDGGSNWAIVTSNYYTTGNTFSWTLPNVSSMNCLVKILDYQNNTVVDQSNAQFTITAPMTITAANGGETWQGGTLHNITWNSSGTSNYYNIDYSTNGGSSWTNIVTNYYSPGKSYSWTVANAPSSNCFVRVTDYSTGCMSDVSDAAFTITPATHVIYVTAPNGGDIFYPSQSKTISWTCGYLSSTFVVLDYSTDNGLTWVNIVPSASTGTTSGSYAWTVPYTISTNCLVKVSEYGNLSTKDSSNTVFSISPNITVTAPNGGENWNGCSSHNITWNAGGTSGYYNIDYSTNGGTIWTNIAMNYYLAGTSCSYSWLIPNVASTSSNCKIRISEYNNVANKTDQNDALFTISNTSNITITSPNGGESWQGATSHNINWTAISGATSGYYMLQYSSDGGASWNTIVSSYYNVNPTISYPWTIPNINSTNCLIRILDANNTCNVDISNAVFTITPATHVIAVTAPNGGDAYYPSQSKTITWTCGYLTSSYVVLDYSIDNGLTWTNITPSTSTGVSSGSYAWTVPFTTSTKCLVKVSEYGNLSVKDSSDAVFSILPNITVGSPNGSESWSGCSSHYISWKSFGTTNYYNIDYSINGGTTWTNIVSYFNGGTGGICYYPGWIVPNTASTNCIIRVSDYSSAATKNDVSDAPFTITTTSNITVTSPNGGESWQGATAHNITWTAVPGTTSSYYTLQYSTDNGSTWNTIVSSYYNTNPAISYSWTVPNTSSTNCLIKILDSNNPCNVDQSNSVFTITPATHVITVTSPNGGDIFYPSQSKTITWTCGYLSSTYVVLDYSIDNGLTWTNITPSTSTGVSSGSYAWTVPFITSTNCLVKVSEYGNLSIKDSSNAVFSILPNITVTSPNGTENWNGCSSHTITWSSGGTTNYYNIEYSTNGGITWTTISTYYNGGTGNCSYSGWVVPNTASTNCKVRVSDYSSAATKNDVSDAGFTITSTSNITVTSPNGGESWQGATPHNITWTTVPGTTSGYYTLQYSTDNGSTWNTIVSSYYNTNPAITYSWTVPNATSTNCLIKILDSNNPCNVDQSNAVFTITPSTHVITITAPNGGESYYPSQSKTISWTCGYLSSSYVVIDYSTNNGATWTNIIPSTSTGASSGSYVWLVPFTTSTNCLVKVSEYGNLSIKDSSNAVFSIVPNITVTSPNGTENWSGCSSHNITWSSGGTTNFYNIDYSINGGTTWTSISTYYLGGTGNCSFSGWVVPNTASTNCKIRVTDYSNAATKNDISDAAFTITSTSNITVTSPNGGESWQGATAHNITWTTVPGTTSGYYTLQYSTDNGSIWNTIVSSYYNTNPAISYSWTVPNANSTNCLIKIFDSNNTCNVDQSDAVFAITPATHVITITAPNGGEALYPSQSKTITWSCAYLSSSYVVLDYSLDNGTTWTNITPSTSTGASSGSYAWTVPFTTSTNCLVKVSEYGNLSIKDSSNAVFSILPNITVTSPNGSENLSGCGSHTLTWKAGGTSIYYNLDYSINGGTTWTNIGIYNGGTGNCSYAWYVPNTASTNCKIRVSDNSSAATKYDISDAAFTITSTSNITVTSPNGGESWQGATAHNITWTTVPGTTSGYYTLQYSTDNGSIWNTIVSGYYNTNPAISYSWTVPNANSANCLIRIYDSNNSCNVDQSNSVFTIIPATHVIAVTSPNGGEIWYPSQSKTISWSCGYLSSTYVVLDYSTDNGLTWTNITPSTSTGVSSGSYAWTVPFTTSTNCLVKVSEYGNLSVKDSSNAVFSILPNITVTSPNGSENWSGCSSHNITWSSGGTTNFYNIEYSTNGGTTWTSLVNSYNGGTGNCSYSGWVVPNTASTNCKIRISDFSSSATKNDVSDAPFTITSSSNITVTSANGGESWQGGTSHNISWTSVPGSTSGYYSLQYSSNGGTSWSGIVSSYYNTNPAINYPWTVDNANSSICLIKIFDSNNTCNVDQSNSVFTITPATHVINVTAPNGGESLSGLTTKNITWTSAYLSSSYVVLDYSTNNGLTWINISPSASNTGSYSWSVPNNIVSTTCLIRVSEYNNPATSDVSDAVFTINPAIRITAPNGGESLATCALTSITWVASGTSNYYNVDYSLNGGTSWTNLAANLYLAGPNCSYAWTLPNTPSTNCLVRVTDYSSPSKTDMSDAAYTIFPTISITQPNNGGILHSGSVYNIKWNSTGVSNIYNIDYSINGGTSWTSIAAMQTIATGTYAWTVPSVSSANCLVRVIDFSATCKTDVCDMAFSISNTPAAITVTSPNGGESWAACTSQNISWTASGTSGNYKVEYSTNGGSTWSTIIASTSSTSYSWTIPNLSTAKCLVRITDVADATKIDQSDAVFSLSAPVANAGPDLAICTGSSTTLTATGGTTYSWYPATGLSDPLIFNPVASPASNTTYTVKVTDVNNCTASDAVIVSVTTTPVVSISGTTTICNGGSTQLTASGATNYLWSPANGLNSINIASPLASPTVTTTYTVTGTTGTCTATNKIIIVVNPLPSIPVITPDKSTTFCLGDSVKLTSSVSNVYSWSPGSKTTQSIVVKTSGSYKVTITDANNCSAASLPTTVTANTLPAITFTPANPQICNGNSVQLTASGALTFSWNNELGSGSIQTVKPINSITYTVSGTDGNNCSNTANISVKVNQLPTLNTVGGTICSGKSATISASGANTYTWNYGLGTGASKTVSPTLATTYTVTGTDVNSCSNTEIAVVKVNPIPTVNASGGTMCYGTSTLITASGVSNYSWSNGLGSGASKTVNPAVNTTYTVTGTDGNNCSNTATAAVTVYNLPATPTITPDKSTTFCEGDSVKLTSSAAFKYSWSPGNQIVQAITVKTTGSFVVTVTDANNCSASSAPTVVTVNAYPVAAGIISGKTSVCQGEIVVVYSVPVINNATSYLWTLPTGVTGTSTSNSITVNFDNTASSGDIKVVGHNNCGDGTSSLLTITLNPVPSAPSVTTPVTYCQNATAAQLTATGTNLKWYTVATGGSVNSTAPTPITTNAGTISYYVSQTTNNCESPRAKLDITVNAIPSAPTVTSPLTYCQNATATQLTATGSNLQWYTVATGGSGSSTAPTPVTTNAGSISYYVSQTTNNCESPRAKLDVTVNAIPSAPTVTTPVTYCQNATASTLTATGSNLKWYTVATGGIGSTTAPTPSTTNVGSTTSYVSQTVSGCESPRSSIDIVINAIPTAPSVTIPVTYCQNATASQLTATGTNLKWYTVATGGSGNSTAPTPITTNAGTISYYVSQTTNNCESPRAKLDVTVNAIPSAPTVTSPVTYCQNATATQLTATGSNLQWYTVATGGSGNSTAPTPITTNTVTISYYVSQTTNNCESPRAKLDVTVNAIPSAPTVTSPVTYCQYATAAQLTATGSNFKWYTVATGGIGSTTAPTPSTTNVGSTTSYVSQTVSGCESPRSSIDVVINAIPTAPSVTTPVTYCQNTTAAQLTATGTNLKWYTVATGGTGSSTAPTPITTNAVTISYYVSQTTNNCESPRAKLDVTVNAIPSAPTVISPVTYCQNATPTQLTATGSNLQWYTVATGGSGNSTAPTPVTTNTGTISYYVSQTTNNCEGSRAKIDVVVNEIPSAPTVTTPVTLCQNVKAAQLTATGTNLKWYSVPTGGTGSSIAPTPITTTAGTKSYYVSQTINNCESVRAAIEIIVNAIPATPVITLKSDTLFSNSTTNNQWYNATGLILNALNPFYVPSITNDYYVIVSNNGCSSLKSNTIHVLVTDIVNYNKIENIFIYPNPVSNLVNIEFENKTKDYIVEIFNGVGQEIYRHLVKSTDNAILRVDLNKQPSGIYFIRMQSTDNIIMRKIMIEK